MKNLPVIALVPYLVFHLGCAATPYKLAHKINTIDAYETFLTEYPDSPDTAKAHKKIEEIHFKKAKKINSTDSYFTFLKTFPEGHYSFDACEKLCNVIHQILTYKDRGLLPLPQIKTISKILLDSSPAFRVRERSRAMLVFLYENLALQYVKAGMYKEARLALALAMEEYRRIGSRYSIIGDRLFFTYDRSSYEKPGSTEIIERQIRMNNSYYDDLKFLNQVETKESLIRLFDVVSALSRKAKTEEDNMAENLDEVYNEMASKSDTTFRKYAIKHFASGAGNSEIASYMFRFDADSTVYPKIELMMQDKPINFTVLDALQDMGENVRENLLSLISGNKSRYVRIHAILGLALLKKDSTSVNYFKEQVLHEQYQKVKLAYYFAIEKLGGSDDLEPMLGYLTSNNKDLRKMALSLLRYTRNPAAGDRLVDILKSGSEIEQNIACQVVKRSVYFEAVAQSLIPLLGSEDKKVRIQAKEALEGFLPQCTALLIDALQNRNPIVRENCISLLAGGKETEGHKAIIEYYENKHPHFSMNDAARYYQIVASEYADYFAEIKRSARLKGGYIPESRLEEFIKNLAKQSAKQFVGNVYIAFGTMKYEAAKDEILKSLADENLSRYAAFALMLYSDTTIVHQVKTWFRKTYYKKQKLAAGFVLAGYGDTDGLDYLLKQLEREHSETAFNLVDILKPLKAIPVLERMALKRSNKLRAGKEIDRNKESLREISSLLARLFVKRNAST